MTTEAYTVTAEKANQTLAALLRHWLPGQSWSQVRTLIASRRVKLNGELWLDDARRLKEGDTVEVLNRALAAPKLIDSIVLRHVDADIVVVEKPSGVSTIRHPAEREWLEKRRLLVPTLDDLVLLQLGARLPRKKHESRARLRVVQRLDKATSGLVVFARTVEAERGLGNQFRQHTVVRRYLALVPGRIESQTIRTFLVRDRGDGRRGSASAKAPDAKEAITHVEVVEHLPAYTLITCRLETGRTHQIRIHLAELGHPVCGEKVYNRPADGGPVVDVSGAPRLALHATELGFFHPITEEPVHWEMPLPYDLREFLDRLKQGKPRRPQP